MSTLSKQLLQKYKNRLSAEYILAIAEMAEGHIDRRFLNDSQAHAALLIDSMILRATSDGETRIYSGCLNAECFNEVLKSGRQKIRILVDNIDDVPESIKNTIARSSGRVEMLQVAKKWTNHFFTMGDSYRYELDDGKAAAVANFNEPAIVINLNKRFDVMWQAADQKIKAQVDEVTKVAA